MTSTNSSFAASPPVPAAEPGLWAGRIAYSAISLACLTIVSCLFGIRARHLNLVNLWSINATRVLVLFIYLTAASLIIGLGVVAGVTNPTRLTCGVAVYTCLVFYVLEKILMYLFLVERAHAVRSKARRGRLHDPIYVTGVVIILIGFGAIACEAFLYPLYKLGSNQNCKIGLPPKVSVPLLAYDIFINVALTGIFVYYLRPMLNFRVNMRQEHRPFAESLAAPDGNARHISKNVEITSETERRNSCSTEARSTTVNVTMPTFASWVHPSTRFEERHNQRMGMLLKKSLIGAFLVLIPTVGNMILLVVERGSEPGWLCFTLCSLDVTLQTCVVHWLTVDPLEVDSPPKAILTSAPSHGSVHELIRV